MNDNFYVHIHLIIVPIDIKYEIKPFKKFFLLCNVFYLRFLF